MNPVTTIKRAFDILDIFTGTSSCLGVTEIASLLNINKVTVSRALATMEAANYIKKSHGSRKYCLAAKVVDLARSYQKNVDLKEIASKHLEFLSSETKEVVHVDIILGDKRQTIASMESTNPVRFVPARTNQFSELHAGAAGKVLLASLPDPMVKEIIKRTGLPRFTAKTITELDALTKELEKIRKEGFAFSEGEKTDYVCSVAAPVRDYMGKVTAALAISWPSVGDMIEKKEKYSNIVRNTAEELSIELGYRKE